MPKIRQARTKQSGRPAKSSSTSGKMVRQIKREANRKRRRDQFKHLQNHNNYIIEVQNLGKNFVSSGQVITRVLDNLNLQINRGEFVVLYGKSGSGKSTLLNILSGLDRPSWGHVVVANRNLPYLSNRELTKFRREHLSFIFQQYHLLNNITGFENVETGAYLKRNKGGSTKIQAQEIKQLFAQFDLLDVIDKFPTQMSGGQQQRISIMRALSKDADIIFADEPTGALDQKTSLIVIKCLQQINQKFNKTIVMVSHDPTIAQYASRVITLEHGKIINDTNWQTTAEYHRHPENGASSKVSQILE